jgi:hypothetical protein
MALKVFISYRRDDSAGHTGRLYDRLRTEFGQDLFMDVDTIPLGTNFVKVLGEAVGSCNVLLAVIGSDWLDTRDQDGTRRLDNPDDFVRIEIGTALKRDIPLIPILLEGTRMPRADQLPTDLKELSQRNALDVRHASFHRDMDKLIRELRSMQPNPAPAVSTHAAATPVFAEKWTLAKAFAYFDGAVPRNPRWSWSARSPDGGTVVLTLWADQIVDDGQNVTVDCYGHIHLPAWKDALGNKERISNLAWARDHCEGLFRVVMVVAADPEAKPRSIRKRYPDTKLVMRLISLNEETGEFRAEGTRNGPSARNSSLGLLAPSASLLQPIPHDVDARSALLYAANRNWTKPLRGAVSSETAKELQRIFDALERFYESASHEGGIRVWGRTSASRPLKLIERSHWQNWHIDHTTLFAGAGAEPPRTVPRDRLPRDSAPYFDLHLNKAEVERLWPRQILAQPDGGPLQILYNESDTQCVRNSGGGDGRNVTRYWVGVHNATYDRTIYDVSLRALDSVFANSVIAMATGQYDPAWGTKREPLVKEWSRIDPGATEWAELFGFSEGQLGDLTTRDQFEDALKTPQQFTLEARARDTRRALITLQYDPEMRPVLRRGDRF